jgi:hypothetical protein
MRYQALDAALDEQYTVNQASGLVASVVWQFLTESSRLHLDVQCSALATHVAEIHSESITRSLFSVQLSNVQTFAGQKNWNVSHVF